MDFWTWAQIVGAVVAGAMLAGMFFYAFLIIARDERGGGDGWHLPARVYVLWSVPLAFLLIVMLTLD